MKYSLQTILTVVCAVGIIGMTGCSPNQDRYEDPDWLGGSSIETLEKRGDYTIFLSLMEKANYKDPIEKQLYTLFVPDDDAFNEYFASIGKNGVDDLTEDEAVNLFTLHVLRNPRSRFYLIYEYAWSELQTPKAEYASLFHRKQTPSTSIPYKETIRYVPGKEGQEVLMYTGDKFVPLWTYEWFGDYGGDQGGSDYLFMYPESSWEEGYTGDEKGMNWHNAMVIPNPEIPEELEVRTSSGFIYFLDRVVPLMPSIEEYMKAHQDKFGVYYDILQRFAQYGNQMVDEQRRVLYRKSYDLVFDLALERGPSTNTAVPPQNMWTAFLPSNSVMQEYLDNTILKYYPTIADVPKVTLFYILQSQLSANVVLMSKLKNGYFNAFGDPTDLSQGDIVSSHACSNGIIYETNKVLEPNVFTCVPGLLFFDQNYSTLLYILNQANMLTSISNPDADVTVFASNNEKLEEYGIRYNETNSAVEFRGPIDGSWRPMRSAELTLFAQDQIIKGAIPDFSGSEETFVELTSGNYIRYSNNIIESGENSVTNSPASIQEVIENELNGYLVKVDNPIMANIVMGKFLSTTEPTEPRNFADPEVSEFAQLLIDSRMLDARYKDPITRENVPNLKILGSADNWTAFIPTNDAMSEAQAQGLIPTDKDSLMNFLNYHFVKDKVIFDNGMESGTFKTNLTYTDTIDNTVKNRTLRIMNSPGNLSVEDRAGRVINVDHAEANILVRKGVVHKVNSVLLYYE